MNLTNFQQFVNIFPIKIFHLVSYSMLMIGIHQFFTRQNFPNPDSSKFFTIKILHHTVVNWLIKVLSTKMMRYAKQKQPIEAVKKVQPSKVETIGMMQIN